MNETLKTLLARLVPTTEIVPFSADEELHPKSANPVSRLVAVHKDHTLRSLEDYQEQPNRIKQSPTLASCESFCAYVERFRNDETTVYLNMDAGNFSAVIDHPGKDSPTWRDHRASFAPKQSLQWLAWLGIHKAPLSQLQFAEFIEENLDDIDQPEPNDVLKAALQFQANEKLVLASTHSLDDGAVEFKFSKENAVQTVTFPHRIKLYIPVFENEDPNFFEARIRYRVSGEGVLTFIFAFVKNPKAIVHDALDSIAGTIKDKLSETQLYEGA